MSSFVRHECTVFNIFNSCKGSRASPNGISSGKQIPIFVHQDVVRKRDSLDSLSDMESLQDVSGFLSDNTTLQSDSPFSKLSKALPDLPSDNDSVMEVEINEKNMPLSPSTGSVYSTASAPRSRPPPTPIEQRPYSFPVSVTASNSFLDLSSPSPHHESFLQMSPADKRV